MLPKRCAGRPTARTASSIRGTGAQRRRRTPLNPLGRVGRPQELADLASFLVCDHAGYINGEMIAIDGSAHLRSSGAEDLLHWTPDQWTALRASRST